MRDSDYLQKVVVYIRKNLAKGYTMESLKWALVKQGYTRSEVDRAIKLANEQLAAEAPRVPEQVTEVMQEPQPIAEEKKGFWKRIFG